MLNVNDYNAVDYSVFFLLPYSFDLVKHRGAVSNQHLLSRLFEFAHAYVFSTLFFLTFSISSYERITSKITQNFCGRNKWTRSKLYRSKESCSLLILKVFPTKMPRIDNAMLSE